MTVLLVWLNLNTTFFFFWFSLPVFLPEVLCERGILAASWRSSVPLHRGRRAHLWVWCSGRYSGTEHVLTWLSLTFKQQISQTDKIQKMPESAGWQALADLEMKVETMSEASYCVLVRWHLFAGALFLPVLPNTVLCRHLANLTRSPQSFCWKSGILNASSLVYVKKNNINTNKIGTLRNHIIISFSPS